MSEQEEIKRHLEKIQCLLDTIEQFRMLHATHGIDKHRIDCLKHLATECSYSLNKIKELINDV